MSSFVNLLDIIYPVGSIYQSMNSTSPASTIGGTWIAITTFLYGSTTSGETGGEEKHTLTISEIPKHRHVPTGVWGISVAPGFSSGSLKETGSGTQWQYVTNDLDKGGDAAHNNMPPYTTCYIWQRTA